MRGHNAVKGKQGFQTVTKGEPVVTSLTDGEYTLPRPLAPEKATKLFYGTTVIRNEIGRATKARWLPDTSCTVTGNGDGYVGGEYKPGHITVRVNAPYDKDTDDRMNVLLEHIAPSYRRTVTFTEHA